MPGISIHVIDVAHGVPASGMRVELFAMGRDTRLLADAAVASSGVVPGDELATATLAAGHYEALFHVKDYYVARGSPLPSPPFLDVVRFTFGIADPAQHYHLPMKVTPWGFSLFRGGA